MALIFKAKARIEADDKASPVVNKVQGRFSKFASLPSAPVGRPNLSWTSKPSRWTCPATMVPPSGTAWMSATEVETASLRATAARLLLKTVPAARCPSPLTDSGSENRMSDRPSLSVIPAVSRTRT